MYHSLNQHKLEFVRLLLKLTPLFFVQICHAAYSTSGSHHEHVSQIGISLDSFSPMNIAIIAVLGLVGLLVFAWLAGRTIRQRRLSDLHRQRPGSAMFDLSNRHNNLIAQARPEKTEVVRNIVVGSEEAVDVKFEQEGVSSRHAELLVLRSVDSSPLMPLEPVFYIRDMSSECGIEVLREGNWKKLQADVVLADEQLKLGEVETNAVEINRLAVESRVVTNDEESPPH